MRIIVVASSDNISVEISNLVDKTLLFKLDVVSATSGISNTSYCIKRVCDDLDIICKFKEMNLPLEVHISVLQVKIVLTTLSCCVSLKFNSILFLLIGCCHG